MIGITMSSHKNRIAKLETKQPTQKAQRLIVCIDGIYKERGQPLTEAEYQAIAADPGNDVTLINVIYASEAQPVSTLTNRDYSVTVGIDLDKI